MLSTPCESVQICTDPDRYSRICRKLISHKNSFEISRLKSALQDKHASELKFRKKVSVRICTDLY